MDEQQLCAKYAKSLEREKKNIKNKDSRGYYLEHNKNLQESQKELKEIKAPKLKDLKEENKILTKTSKKKQISKERKTTNNLKKTKNYKSKSKKAKNNFINKKEENHFLQNYQNILYSNKDLKSKISELKSRIKKNNKKDYKNILTKKLEKKTNKLLSEENKILKQKIKSQENQILILKSEKAKQDLQIKDSFFLEQENENLKNEISQLFQMLKKTEKYKEFTAFADVDGNLRYLTDINFYNKKNDFEIREKSKLDHLENFGRNFNDFSKFENLHKNCLKTEKVKNSLKWVPENCLDLLKDIQKENSGLSNSCINYILFELNKIWKNREEKIYEKAYVFCKNCKNKNLLRNLGNCKFMTDEKKDNLIAELRSKNFNLKSRLKKKNNFVKNDFVKKQNNLIRGDLANFEKKNNYCKNLERKNKFLDRFNKMLVEILDKNKMRNFFEINGEIKNAKKLKNIFAFLKNNILKGVENVYQSVISEKNRDVMTKQFLSIEKIKKEFDRFENKLLKIENIKNNKYESYKKMCIK